ncbi:hypothetical protein [Paucilactobacillus sp. N302-9]|jgi:hypothetical protein
MAKLSKQQKKAMIEQAEEQRAKNPQPQKKESGFATIDHEAEKLSDQN